MAAHVGLRTVGLLVDERKALQKLVQCALATIKGLNGVRAGQSANWLISLRTQPSSPGSDRSFLSLGLALTGWPYPSLRIAVHERTVAKAMQPKVGRNETCPCGSGKKFKKCCGGPSNLH